MSEGDWIVVVILCYILCWYWVPCAVLRCVALRAVRTQGTWSCCVQGRFLKLSHFILKHGMFFKLLVTNMNLHTIAHLSLTCSSFFDLLIFYYIFLLLCYLICWLIAIEETKCWKSSRIRTCSTSTPSSKKASGIIMEKGMMKGRHEQGCRFELRVVGYRVRVLRWEKTWDSINNLLGRLQSLGNHHQQETTTLQQL